ncbi:hypothetical protein MKX01_019570 [Papaver californicum]|nr:hypothetical protein MKX01_019570 [Papaver californicum]
MAPVKLRGALNMGFQLAITIGILATNLVNYGTTKIKGGYRWRVSLALAVVPAIIMTIGAIFLSETPIHSSKEVIKRRLKLCCRKSKETKNLKKNSRPYRGKQSSKEDRTSMEDHTAAKIHASTHHVHYDSVLPTVHWYQRHGVLCTSPL